MKAVLVFVFLFSGYSQAFSQNFCGVIRYKYTYHKPKNNKDITKKINDFRTEDFYICGNKFKVYFDGELKDIFIGDSLMFFHVGANSTIGFIKADSAYGQDPTEYTNYRAGVLYKKKTYNTVDNIEDGEVATYFFTDDVAIDAAQFSKVELYHWNKFFEATHGGLRQVLINKTKELTMIAEAIEITPMPLTDKDFALPAGYTIQPFGLLEVLN